MKKTILLIGISLVAFATFERLKAPTHKMRQGCNAAALNVA